MKREFFLSITLSLIIGCCLVCCKSEKPKEITRESLIEEFRSELTESDTTTMLRLCDEIMDQLKADNVDGVLTLLYEYNDSTHEVKPLSNAASKRYSHLFRRFPVKEYNRVYFSFMLEGCNDVKYEVTFATADQTGTGKPATTMYMFNPVRIDGQWKICVKTPQNEFDTTR